jgi:hypothetical protein
MEFKACEFYVIFRIALTNNLHKENLHSNNKKATQLKARQRFNSNLQ